MSRPEGDTPGTDGTPPLSPLREHGRTQGKATLKTRPRAKGREAVLVRAPRGQRFLGGGGRCGGVR